MRSRLFVAFILIGYAFQLSAQEQHVTRAWGNIDYKGKPWVKNMSRPNDIKKGLANRHVAVWASHGRYFDQEKMCWKWQRPNLFGTTEDLFTQTIVVPFLIPMLENAGANVFTPRERDWQKHEVIVDNDTPASAEQYLEVNVNGSWQEAPVKGFRMHEGSYVEGENPFEKGTARMAKATKRKNASLVSYQPNIPQEGRYAVYVSYPTTEKSVDDAQYIVYHKGQQTEFRVNQQMGGGTWVYLGTFDFDAGCNQYNRVVITNNSRKRKGYVATDAIRFGGGMGNIERGGQLSGLPRCLEGARYYAQWAGAPYNVYSGNTGTNDYGDDINVRSRMTNWLGGGSIYIPTLPQGKKVPIELSLAIHSDAGFAPDGQSLIGSLAIATTNFNDGRLSSGISRMASLQFAKSILDNATNDLSRTYNRPWAKRYLWNRNYSETRLPEVPSAIFETLSHQNFPDMVLAQDPNFRFTLARSIYKTILKYISEQHDEDYAVEPLAPTNFRVEFVGKNKLKLSWQSQPDKLEPTAAPSSYNVYVATESSGFDNGKSIKGTSTIVELEPGVQYNFRVTACNKGGESFPTETLSACYSPEAVNTVLIVNNFHRLSAPAILNTADRQGFDLDADPGVSYGLTAGWNGRQQCFDKSKMGIEGPGGLGYCGDELAGSFIQGNTFDYTVDHATAIKHAGRYNIVSCSSEAVVNGYVKLTDYKMVDLIQGLEKYTQHAVNFYKTFTPGMQNMLATYTRHGGALLVSGAYIGSDMQAPTESSFLGNVLKAHYVPTDSLTTQSTVNGLGMQFDIYRSLNDRHYAATSVDVIQPTGNAIVAMQYADGSDAAIAYRGNDYRCFTMGFPFECIIDRNTKNRIMQGILDFLMK